MSPTFYLHVAFFDEFTFLSARDDFTCLHMCVFVMIRFTAKTLSINSLLCASVAQIVFDFLQSFCDLRLSMLYRPFKSAAHIGFLWRRCWNFGELSVFGAFFKKGKHRQHKHDKLRKIPPVYSGKSRNSIQEDTTGLFRTPPPGHQSTSSSSGTAAGADCFAATRCAGGFSEY